VKAAELLSVYTDALTSC